MIPEYLTRNRDGSLIKLRCVKTNDNARLPEYAHPGDAGMDLFASEDAVIYPGERKVINTSIIMAIPKGYVGLVWDRSGLAASYGLTVLAGVIDSGYRGEIKVVIFNTQSQLNCSSRDIPYNIKTGNKIAQMLIQPVANPVIFAVDKIEDTDRGEGGFGSTGV